ncbi:MAG TPA: amino acid permease [Thermoanaerobaculia bacterium]|nr:amino acid permease [Thermoanaerobaculia bacterium]
MPEPGSPTFARHLNLFDATMIVVSGIIGSGIFINPYVVARAVHTPMLILAVWGTGGAIALCGAFVFAELATVMPRVGGQYAFFREAFHPLVAFLHGWGLLLIVQCGATAAVAVAFAQYVARLIDLPAGAGRWLAALLLLALAGFHALGIKPGAILINVVTFAKTLAIAALIAGAFVLTRHTGLSLTPATPPGLHGLSLLSAFFAGLVPAMFAYGGWQNLNYVAEEVSQPERNLPRAILIGVCCVIAVYLGANVAYIHVLSAPVLAATQTPAADMAARLVGEGGAKAISLLIVISAFGFLNLSLLSAPRVYYAMAADGLFFRSFARLSRRFRAPTAAILLQGGLAAVYAFTGTYDRLLSFVVFADWIFFALAGAALLVFRHKLPQAARPYPTPGYPWIPALFILVGAGIVGNIFFTDIANALAGVAIFLLGIPVYFLWRLAAARRPPATPAL